MADYVPLFQTAIWALVALGRLEGAVAQLFLTTMSEAMFENLRKLATGSFGPYHWSDGLERELYYLRDIGYLSVRSIRAIPHDGAELSQHVSVTDPGKKFVALRLQLKSQFAVDSYAEINS